MPFFLFRQYILYIFCTYNLINVMNTVQKSEFFLNKLVLLFSSDALNW